MYEYVYMLCLFGVVPLRAIVLSLYGSRQTTNVVVAKCINV